MNLLPRSLVLAVAWASLAPAAWAEPTTPATAARRLAASTVTVRIWPGEPATASNGAAAGGAVTGDVGKSNAEPADKSAGGIAVPQAAAPQVIVSSGVCVGPGLIVTGGHPLVQRAPAGARYRITQSDGRQAKAVLCVLDHYSNLCLLQTDSEGLPALDLAAELPEAGETVLTAAAAGIERPVVSVGTLGAVDRSAGNSGLPPLLQCDLRTTEASGGAAVVDGQGKLIGIVMATDLAGERSSWTFAVPLRHVQRVLDARRQNELVVLERRRPTVGLTLGQGPKEGTVVVERVVPGGPADKGGILPGDLIVEAGGRKIRSAYQAVDLILTRQPGETIALVVERKAEQHSVSVTLGGGTGTVVRRDATPGYAAPQVNVRVVGRNQIEVRNGAEMRGGTDVRSRATVAELAAGGGETPPRIPREELAMLQAQLAAFEKVIVKLQAELRHRDQVLEETNELVKSLSSEVESLRKQPTPAK